jgi:hypothetical protein
VPYADPEKRREFKRRWMVAWRTAKPESARASLKKWRAKNPNYRRNRYQTDENTRIADNLRATLYQVLRHQRSGRDWDADAKLRGIIGCSRPALIAHIEAQFLPGMSWANYGRKGWELDHIKPCASFDLTRHDQVLLCFHHTNLRPLWRVDNQRRPRKEVAASWQ